MQVTKNDIIQLFKQSVTPDAKEDQLSNQINLTVNGNNNQFINLQLPCPESSECKKLLEALQMFLKPPGVCTNHTPTAK